MNNKYIEKQEEQNDGVEISDDPRKIKRGMNVAIRNDLVKILTELITNSDDSHGRMIKRGENTKGARKIEIRIDKRTSEIFVIDNAEGMDIDTLKNNFETYGSDKSGRSSGYKVRGLFGQGALDVMLTRENSVIQSAKDGKLNESIFYWDENDKRKVLTKESEQRLREFRHEYNIKQNGTVVRFSLKSRFDSKKITMPINLKDKLQNFYMLRHIFSNPDLDVCLGDKTGKKDNFILNYKFPKFDEENTLFDNYISFNFEQKKINGKLKLYKAKDKNKMEKRFGDLQILVYDDEKNVYDNTFFQFEKLPGAEYVYGELELQGTADIIRNKLNAKSPELILTDTREGFDKRCDFYKKLANCVEPKLQRVLKDMEGEIGGEQIKSQDFKQWKNAFSELNKYMEDKLDENNDVGVNPGIESPIDGLRFARERIKVTSNKKYTVKLLINPEIIKPKSKIEFSISDKTKVEMITNKAVIFEKGQINKNGVGFVNVCIRGKDTTEEDCEIIANCKTTNKQARLFCSVMDEEVYYPKYGFEFYPNTLNMKPKSEAKLHLYFDTSKYKIGTKIKLKSTDQDISLKVKKVKIKKENLIVDTIGKIDVGLISRQNGQNGRVVARCRNYSTEASIFVRDENTNIPGNKGFLNGWDIVNQPSRPWQQFYNPKDGMININGGNYINQYYFGDSNNKNMLKNKIEKDLTCQRYLADLIADEVAKLIVKKMILQGKITDKEDTTENYELLIDEHQKEKNKIAGMVYKTANDIKF